MFLDKITADTTDSWGGVRLLPKGRQISRLHRKTSHKAAMLDGMRRYAQWEYPSPTLQGPPEARLIPRFVYTELASQRLYASFCMA